MSLQSFPIVAPSKGLVTNKKPAFIPDDAWQTLENAYTWREREVKREGLKFLGRLRRVLLAQSLGTTPAGPPNTFTINNIFTTLTLEASGELLPGSLVIKVAAPDTASFTDNGDGTFTVTGSGVAAGSYVNYNTGKIVLQFTGLVGGAAVTANLSYFPVLPCMGICTRDLSAINNEQTIWFDTTYAYIWNGSSLQEFIPGTTWNSSDSDFFWGFNYRGAADNQRLFFETNFVNTGANPMRYTDGNTWNTFQPIIADNPPSAAQSVIYTARIIIAYYGRLVLLNTFEGTTAGGNAGAVNFFNRARFCQFSASPIAADAFRSDQFGKGGFIDAPTNEAIIGAMFIKNTLIVEFEQSTWELRYIGEYGAPFIWERVSADFGSESTFSSVLFDNQMLAVGDKAIIAANAVGVNRIDLDIPDQIFDFKNANNGVKRVYGIRNYQKELVYWNYPDAQTGTNITFPNKVLLYNYRNNTWAIFRDSVTAFGNFQSTSNVIWDSFDVIWDDEQQTWDDVEDQSLFPSITSGNQQGFISLYQEDEGFETTPLIQEQPSLSIHGVTLTSTLITLNVPNHNLLDDEIILIRGMLFLDQVTFVPITTSLNDTIYKVTVVDSNNITISKWNGTNYAFNFSFTPSPSDYLYIGNGTITLIPKLNLVSKDINLYQAKSLQTKLSRLDFLMDATPSSAMTVNLNLNTSSVVKGNVLVGNKEMSTALTAPFYPPGANYAWFRFYATLAAQYFSINITYDDALMNSLTTHQQGWTMYAINAWCRPGGKNVF